MRRVRGYPSDGSGGYARIAAGRKHRPVEGCRGFRVQTRVARNGEGDGFRRPGRVSSTSPGPITPAGMRGWELAVLLGVVASVTLPFLDKPFHVDDPFILQVTGNILANPLDPFAGVSAWFGSAIPIWQQATNIDSERATGGGFARHRDGELPDQRLLVRGHLW